MDKDTLMAHVIDLTVGWLANGNARVSADDVTAFLKSASLAVASLDSPADTGGVESPSEHVPATSVRKSLASEDHIISMIDGKPYRALKRHLTTNGLTPDEYRARYNLKSDYPMTAPSYSVARSALAKSNGLGRKKGDTAAARKANSVKVPARRKALTPKFGA